MWPRNISIRLGKYLFGNHTTGGHPPAFEQAGLVISGAGTVVSGAGMVVSGAGIVV